MLEPTHKSSINNHQVQHFNFQSQEGRDFAKEVQDFKRRLDVVLNSVAWRRNAVLEEDLKWAEEQGFDLGNRAPTGQGIPPDQFVRLLVGSNIKYTSADSILANVPASSLIGWNRRRHKAEDQIEANEKMEWLDELTIAKKDGHAALLNPFGLIVCGEGKHRYELFADFSNSMLANISQLSYPDPRTLQLRRVRGAPGMLYLSRKGQGVSGEGSLLPFGDLSARLLASVGLEVTGTWTAVPWSRTIDRFSAGSISKAIRYCLNPNLLRTALLNSVYV